MDPATLALQQAAALLPAPAAAPAIAAPAAVPVVQAVVQPPALLPPAPPPLLPFAPLAAPPANILTYQDYFSDATNDGMHGAYQVMSDDITAPINGASRYGQAVLAERVVGTTALDIPLAFVCHCRNIQAPNDVGSIQVFHWLTSFPTSMLGPAQPWAGLTFAITGDVVNKGYYLSPFPAANFGLAPQGTFVLPDDEAHVHSLAFPQTLMPVTTDQTPNAVEVRTRFTTWVPFVLVHLLLPALLPPAEAFRRVYEAAQINNLMGVCRPLLDFLKVASTAIPGGGSAVSRAWPNLSQPPNASLINFFDHMVERDLPSWRVAPAEAPTLIPVVEALDRLSVEQREGRYLALARIQRAAEEPQAKLPSAVFGRQPMDKLCCLCQVDDEAQLPALWHELANCPTRSRVSVTQQAFETVLGNLPFTVIATVALVGKLNNVALGTHDSNDLSQGIGPFQFGLITPDRATQIAYFAQMYYQLQGGGAHATLADTQTLEAPDKALVATDLHMVRESFGGLGIALAAILGVNHPVVRALSNLLGDLDQNFRELRPQLVDEPRLPVLFQRYVQVQLFQWFKQQARTDDHLPFHLDPIAILASNGMYNWVARLPPSLLGAHNLAGSAGASNPPPVCAPRAPPPSEGGLPAGTANGGVPNPGYDTRFDSVRARSNVRSRDVRERCRINKVPLPLDTNGKVRCLPFHIKGNCNEGCGSAHDHHNRHTEADQVRLLEWSTQYWVPPS